MRWFWKKPGATPANPLPGSNVFGEIVLPEPSEPGWRKEKSTSDSDHYLFKDSIRIWCYHPDKTGALYVDGQQLFGNDKQLYRFCHESVDAFAGFDCMIREKKARLAALAKLSKLQKP